MSVGGDDFCFYYFIFLSLDMITCQNMTGVSHHISPTFYYFLFSLSLSFFFPSWSTSSSCGSDSIGIFFCFYLLIQSFFFFFLSNRILLIHDVPCKKFSN